MRKLIGGPAILVAIAAISGCTSIPTSEQPVSTDMSLARQNVKIYDAMPQYGTAIDQVSVSLCDGSREAATDRLLAITNQRGGNGIIQLACTSEGMSFSCWSKNSCTATAIKVSEPPPPPPPKKRGKAPPPKPKKKT
jgi:hypothetical protein